MSKQRPLPPSSSRAAGGGSPGKKAGRRGSPLRVAVVDDSSFVRRAIARMLGDDPRLEIVGQASSGEELLAQLEHWQPDVITLDLSMPGMGGLQTLDRIMSQRPTPVIILSTHSAKDAPLTIEALHRGAMDFIDKQRYSLVDFESLRAVITEKILEVTEGTVPLTDKTLTEKSLLQDVSTPEPVPEEAAVQGDPKELCSKYFDLLLVGASTGGPPTIQRLLQDLGPEVPVPVAIVQHMPQGFTKAFAERLNAVLPLQVHEAIDGEPLLPAHVYIAPAGLHLRFSTSDDRYLVSLEAEPADVTHRPSVDVLYEAAAKTVGSRVLAVLMTGMGSDGAVGMMRLRHKGAYTVVQDQDSCVVYGMPRAAVKLQAAREEVAMEGMGKRLLEILHKGPETGTRRVPKLV